MSIFDDIASGKSITSFDGLKKAATDATELFKQADKAAEDLNKVFDQEWAKNYEPVISEMNLSDAEMKPFNQKFADWQRQKIKETDSVRWAPLRKLKELDDGMAVADEIWKHSTSVLNAETIGTPERTACESQVAAGLGGVGLKNLALRAVETKNLALAAVVMNANSQLPVNQRMFSNNELADSLVGAKCKAARENIATVRAAMARGLHAVRSAEGKKPDAFRLAFVHGDRLAPERKPGALPGRPKSAHDRIREGLEARAAAAAGE